MSAVFIARRLRAREVLVGWGVLVVLGASLGCNAVFDIEEGQLAPTHTETGETDVGVDGNDGGSGCVLSSDCEDDSLICIFRVCSQPCRADRDCLRGERCLQTDEGMACVLGDSAVCDSAADCPLGTGCTDGECRNQCTEDDECLEDQECIDQRCIGTEEPTPDEQGIDETDPDGDEPTDESDNAPTDDPTVDESDEPEPTDATPTDEGGSETADGGTDVDETDTDVEGTDSTPEPVDCDELEEGTIVCDGYGGTTRSACEGGDLVTATPCTSGNVCDPATGECEPPATECVGRSPGAVYCSGAQRIACAPSLLSAQSSTCASNAHCQAGSGPDCALCLDGTFTCVDNQVHECSADGSEWEPTDDPPCTSSAPCNPDTGTCTTLACLEGQQRCQGDSLQECNDGQSAFAEIEECAPGLCDPVNLECDVCTANTSECASNGTQRLVCDSQGQTVNTVNCAAPTPYCRGSGECVQCTLDTHCPQQECSTPTCNVGAGTCSQVPQASGTDCATGVCNGAGSCVECVGAGDCTAQDACHVASCMGGSCQEEPRGEGATCNFDGGSVCNASGDCVECLTATTCTTTNGCYDAICTPAGACDEDYAASNTSCNFSGGTVCDGEGNCVECLSPTQCTATNACFRPTCEAERCDEIAEAAGATCSFNGGRVCDGAGNCVECNSNSECDEDFICRDGDCEDAVDTVGFDTGLTGSATAATGQLYLRPLPRLQHAASIRSLGVVGTGTGASIKIAIYADNGTGDGPEGNRITEVSNLALIDGANSLNVALPASLAAGVDYWIAFKVNADISIATGPTVAGGRRVTGQAYADSWPAFDGTPDPGSAHTTGFGVFMVVEYTE